MKYALLTLVLFTGASLFAQQTVKGGMAAYDRGDYEDAIEILSKEMKIANQLKSKDRANGWYYLGLAKKIVISNAMSIQDKEGLKRFKGYDLDSYYCLEKAMEAKENEKIKEDIIQEIEGLFYVIFNSANTQYLLGDNTTALKYYGTAAEIAEKYTVPGDYQVYNLRGQTYLALSDSTKAYSDFAKATERYIADQPEIPDANIGYAYYSMAVIERYNNNNLDRALEMVQAGNDLMDDESERLRGLLNDGSSDQRMLASQSEQFNNIMDALNRFELDIYNASPEKYDEAVAKFQKAIAENPSDANMHLVYGNLIEYNDPQGAYEAYVKAIEIDPESSVAQFNAGVNRVNEGVKYARKGNEEFDFQKAEEWRKKTNEQFALALPHLEKAHELEPDNIYVIDALLQVTIQLEMMDEYKMYKEKQKMLRGY